MNKVLAFAGKKGSGKNTLCNFLTGYQLRSNNIVDSFDVTNDGKLYIEQGEQKGVLDLDLYRVNDDFYQWASFNVWPYAKIYAFAEPLKELCIEFFGVPREIAYGTDEQKNSTLVPHMLWENMPGVITPGKLEESIAKELGLSVRAEGSMTVREILQYVGSDIFRKMWNPVWVNMLQKTVKVERSTLSLICDARFDNEILGAKALEKDGFDVKVVELTKGKNTDKHISENGFTGVGVDFVLDNANMTLPETCRVLVEKIQEWGWFR